MNDNKKKIVIVVLSIAMIASVCLFVNLLLSSNEVDDIEGNNNIINDTNVINDNDNTINNNTPSNTTPNVVQTDNGSGIEESPSNLDIKEEQQQQSSSNDNNTSLPDKPNEDDPTDSQQLQDIVLDISSLKFTAEEYIKYCSLSEDEQYDFYNSFNSSDDFFSWYNKAKEEYDKLNPITVINPGDAIDLSGD